MIIFLLLLDDEIMSSVSMEQLFANTITSNASIQAHLEIILRNQAETISRQTGEDEKVLLSTFRFDINTKIKLLEV